MRTPFAIIAALLAVLVPLGILTDAPEEPGQPVRMASVATIAERVEALRGLRYERVPRPERVTGAQARRDALGQLDADYPPAARHADETLYAMLDLLPEDTDLGEISGTVFGEGVAGYYDPRSKRLKIVTGGTPANRVVDEMILAHELTHALEDDAIGLDDEALATRDDRSYAYTALVEGTATDLMVRYVGKHFDGEAALAGLLTASVGEDGTEDLPPFVTAGLLFPYLEGQAFVTDLRRRAGDSWTLVDLAARSRPPTTTEQILHPGTWVDAEPVLRVAAPGSPGRGWRRLTQGVFGEWQTGQLLGDPAPAVGWGGDRYVLYGRGATARRLRMRWRFDTPRDLRAFVPALRRRARDLPGARVRASAGSVLLEVSRA